MPARRGRNLRKGDLAEEVGLTILQNLSLVAPIPRTEDVGIDGVVTLLEYLDINCDIATKSFFVQIKAKSKKEITYKNEEVDWLFNLELPFFIAVVDRSKLKLELYCCHRISEAAFKGQDFKEVNLIFDDYDESTFLESDNNIPIGPPIMSISMQESVSQDARDEFVKVCRPHILWASDNIKLREAGVIYDLSWKEKEAVQAGPIPKFKNEQGNSVLNQLSHISSPYIASLAAHSLANLDNSHISQVITELQVVKDVIDGKKPDILSEPHKVYKLGEDVFPCGDGDEHIPFNTKDFFTGKKKRR